jgi:hypothetical protein
MAQFVRKGTPDAGVECYAVLPDGSEWGWQAKYFDVMGKTQWEQIDKSVRAALKGHPRLAKYYICVPLNRSDARVAHQVSMLQQWDRRRQKWIGWAQKQGLAVEFVWWGSHELLQELMKPEHIGRRSYWFDVSHFSREWFLSRFNEARGTVGVRYTPELHVDMPISRCFDALLRSETLFNTLKAYARPIRERLRGLIHAFSGCNEPQLCEMFASWVRQAEEIISEITALNYTPVGDISLARIAGCLKELDDCDEDLQYEFWLKEKNGEELSGGSEAEAPTHSSRDAFEKYRHAAWNLSEACSKARVAFEDAVIYANNSLMLLKGDAGTGKTHLLCDVVRRSVESGLPAILLTGKRFNGVNDPWVQVLQHMDYQGTSEKFIGALETAAQTTNSRALFVIDALNEGPGREIWQSNLAAFLSRLARSPWISTVLSVRTSYEEIVIPEEVAAQAVPLVHEGFSGYEYDAAQQYFLHYGIEFPSAPFLSSEYSSPIFLKTLCEGLHKAGKRRVPRGFNGITVVFTLYLESVNKELSKKLNYRANCNYVKGAIDALVQEFVKAKKKWLVISRAEQIVNSLLPSQAGYEGSLYRGLLDEGVLLEDILYQDDVMSVDAKVPHIEVVSIAYERLSDHLIAKQLLDQCLDPREPESAFADNGPLALVYDVQNELTAGLIEALCVQLPERIPRELACVAPRIQRWSHFGHAFRQSLAWRDFKAFTDETLDVLNGCIRTAQDNAETIQVILTVASIPEHPLNAYFLDGVLHRLTMPDRDAWWSVDVCRLYRKGGFVDRLVDWATYPAVGSAPGDETVELCAIALTWLLTTPLRVLRDRSTKALVSLLTGRVGVAISLIERFHDVDDPYLSERLYAVAYGIAMRSYKLGEVGSLAKIVYRYVFAEEPVRAHILLRDFARGVIERALYLGADIDIDVERIHPPYNSVWPNIPTKSDIAEIKNDPGVTGADGKEKEWGKIAIINSVLYDDFGRYVIGTNGKHLDWLSLRLDEPCWLSAEELRESLSEKLSEEQYELLELYELQDRKLRTLQHWTIVAGDDLFCKGEWCESDSETRRDEEYLAARKARHNALQALRLKLNRSLKKDLDRLLNERERELRDRTPQFDLRLIQRYVLWRVFDLGWTSARFGSFDVTSKTYSKAAMSGLERVGKKYQWIAYYEILALIADHFQYADGYDAERGKEYEGTWQLNVRNMDPSCTIRSIPEDTGSSVHKLSWWSPIVYDNWGRDDDPRGWVAQKDDLPPLERLIRIEHPNDGSVWVNVHGFLDWSEPIAPDLGPEDAEHRNVWFIINAYFIPSAHLDSFMQWANAVNFYGRWMPEPPSEYRLFFGEYFWSPAYRFWEWGGWRHARNDCPTDVRCMSMEYLKESSGFDYSVDGNYRLQMPDNELTSALGLRWTGRGSDFENEAGELVAMDPTVPLGGPPALLLREDVLRAYLDREGLAIVWSVVGEKHVFGPSAACGFRRRLPISGAYTLGATGPEGFLKYVREVDDEEEL